MGFASFLGVLLRMYLKNNKPECLKYNDIYMYLTGVLNKKKWENCMEMDRYSWGYRRNARLADYFSMHELLSEVAETVR